MPSKDLFKNSFYYFAFGSNLLKERLSLANKSCYYIGVGALRNYALDFVGYSGKWHGMTATVIPSNSDNVWGTIWELDCADLGFLDEQESVPTIYYPIETYVFLDNDDSKVKNFQI